MNLQSDIEKVLNEMFPFGDVARMREAAKEVLTLIEQRVVEVIEGMKYTDPRSTNHKSHPNVSWEKCIACVENYHYNQALADTLSRLHDLFNVTKDV